jgi:DNA-binding MarR family transcriptional regulator
LRFLLSYGTVGAVSDDPQRLSPTKISDPKAVLAVTHPLRMRLLGELSRRGTARVVDLANALGEPANSVSFHLRQLAKYGLIENNPERSDNGRERWWRMTSDRGFEIDLDAMRQLEGGEAAVGVFRRVAEGHVLALHRAIHEPPSPVDHPGGRQRTISDDFAVRLSDSELQQMRLEFAALLDRWTDTSRALNDVGDGVERHAYYGVVMAALIDDISATTGGPRKEQHP